MTRHSEQPPRQSLIREIVELLKEHPQGAKWLKILGGGYLVIQLLGLLFGAVILYVIYSAFISNTSKFDERRAEFDRVFEERRRESEERWKDFGKNFDESIQQMKQWDEMNRKSLEKLRKPIDFDGMRQAYEEREAKAQEAFAEERKQGK